MIPTGPAEVGTNVIKKKKKQQQNENNDKNQENM